MGVHGLWELLAPVGRRVSVETLAGKKLAIDASIWMVQFMKAMRDEKGEMVHNAHLLGFFRRICKLLFLRIKPVFVFDGATPALKRRTLAARRRHRDNAQAKIRKTAEKLLLNHLKARKLEELAAEIKNSRRQDDDLKGKKVMDESKGKQVLSSGEESGAGGSDGRQSAEKAGGGSTQESLDELLAASLAAEEERKFNESELASVGDGPSLEQGDDDDDEEMIFPIAHGKIDPTVLASLPPSMQLDLLVQMRERVMAENRQRYQKIKKAPAKFSELQIQSYLKTVAFRREIDEVQKAAGRGLGGVQTSRIASEANREFIFSSSFTGDKQMLTSRGVEKSGNVDHHALEKPMISNPASQSKSATDVSVSELIRDFGPDVETYCDERGHVRVSRVRGLGMHMTRDLQRNLDLMKEYEQEKVWGGSCKDPEPTNAKEVPNVSKSLSENSLTLSACISNERNGETTSTKNGALILEDENHRFHESPILGNKNAIEISFSEDDSGMKDIDDNLFHHLVSGSPTAKLFDRNSHPDRSTSESESECIWEEGMVEGNAGSQKSGHKESQSFLAERNSYEEDEVDWEDGVCHVPRVASPRQAKPEKSVSIGLLEEEADMQEAIRRSLEDFEKRKSSIMTSENQILGKSSEDRGFVGSLFNNSTLSKSSRDTNVHLESHIGRSLPLSATMDEHGQHDNASRQDVLQMTDSGKKHLSPSTSSGVDVDRKSSPMNDSKDDESGRALYQINVPSAEPVDGHLGQIEQCCLDTSEVAKNEHNLISTNEFAETSYDISANTSSVPDAVLSAAHHDDRAASQSSLAFGKGNNDEYSQKSSLVEEAVDNNGKEPEQVIEKNSIPDSVRVKTTIQECPNDHTDLFEAHLDNEISLLRQECFDLGNEQRKLERNAETVSSEMFAECQELLQMFGLPYIIAPMEAEAQCAYMEMTKLVDGVVTDDSDVFLFGARSVYKNIFDDRKYVETYFMKDIESELGLNRGNIIRMALLLGSDYTEGVSGIGIVNAIEVVHAFAEEDGLNKFREWIESPDPSILEKLDSHTGCSSRKRSSKASKEDADGMRKNVELSTFEETVSGGHDDQPSVSGTQDIKDVFMSKHRNVSKNWHIPPSFPSESVITAYTSPQVDESTEPFSWGKPDLVLLRKLCWERFGWGNQKADELLVPVLNEYSKHETQLRLEAFFTFNERFAKIRSQRIKKALKGITGTCSSDLTDDLVQEDSSSRKKRRLSPSMPEGSTSDNCSNAKTKRGRQVSKQPRKQNTGSKNMHPVDVATESVILNESESCNQSGLCGNVRGSRRGKGRGTGRGRGRRITEEKLNYEPGDDAACTGASESHTEVPEAKSELRRSTRPRKHVKYAEEVLEVDELNVSSNRIDENDLHEVAVEHKLAEEDGSATIRDSILGKGGSHPENSLSRDSLLRGGGFCADKNDAQGDAFQPGDSQMQGSAGKDEDWVGEASGLDYGKESPLKGNFSGDYLHSGGGFCMDESNLQGEAIQPAASPVMDSVGPLGEMSCVSKDTQSLDLGCISGNEGTKRVSEDIVLGDLLEVHDEVKPGLSAMPSLQRKRRKL
ncbi:DNA repair protein UVH3 [Phoenix dactylifera]|uniref:DNA repair protein UVH3 n=1 Tax=Phoenix dactylifera TaxID=42345 RepID=A0A8B7MUX8_PHODC|nr:DNA repair protein UVH3 [Phoenix dactylifera]